MKKWMKITLITLAGILVVGTAGFFLYVSDYYRADEMAVSTMSGNPSITTKGNLTILAPGVPSDIGIIFYPGGKVEHTAYLPLLERLRQNGLTCVLVEMPFRLAVFDPNAADSVFDMLPELKTWYIGGHSLGGAMASNYAAAHPQQIKGAILLGSYVYGGLSDDNALTVYGSEDRVLDRSKITYTHNVLEIEGGNHAQFGNYGAQKGDGVPAISAQEQQNQTADAILEFIKNR